MKTERLAQVIARWCGQRPARGSDKLNDLWDEHGPQGVPFDDEGAERLIRELDQEFPGHGLRPVDVLDLSVDGLLNAIPDDVVAPAAMAMRGVAPELAGNPTPLMVSLTDDTIERLARRLAELLGARKGQSQRQPTAKRSTAKKPQTQQARKRASASSRSTRR